jgi:hypothetical protein
MALDASKADAAVAEVRRVYRLANLKLAAAEAPPFAVGTWLFGDSSARSAADKNLTDMGKRIDTWAGTYRRWAAAGRRDDGTPYSATSWAKHGEELGRDAAFHAGEFLNAGLFAGFNTTVSAVKATVQTVKELSNPSGWPTWAIVAAGLAALAVLGPYVTPLIPRVLPKG